MRTAIIGAGKVGYNIAQVLSKEGHDVIVIEHDEDRGKIVEENLDVQVLVGNGASAKIFAQMDIEHIDLLVAVTEFDELNMLSCMLAKQHGVMRTVARVRDPDYADDVQLAKNPLLGIDLLINPEKVAAKEIMKLIKIPEALNVNYFAGGMMQMLELMVQPDNKMVGKALKDIRGRSRFLIVAIIRREQVIIPRGDDKLKTGDRLFVMAETDNMKTIERSLGFEREMAHSVMILGGSRIGFYLATLLEGSGLEVKIVEKDYAHCRKLAALLDETIILHGDGSDVDLLQEEGIKDTDVLVALTEDDKLNLLVSLLAKRLGAGKTIAQIRRSDYVPLIEAILQFVRKGNFLSIAILEQGHAEVYEVVITPQMSKLVNKEIKQINFPKGSIIAAIFRQGRAIIPGGQDILMAGDRITIFAAAHVANKIEGLFH